MSKQRSNSAKKKLGEQPFRTVSDKKDFVDKIKKEVLTRLETAKAMEEFTNQDEYRFFKDKFRNGMLCKYESDLNGLVHISLDDDGMKVEILEATKETKNQNEWELIGQLVKSMSHSLIVSYFEVMGYLSKGSSQSATSASSNLD